MLWSAVAITIFQDASAQAADSSLTLIAFWLYYLTIAMSSSPSFLSRVSTSCACSDHNHKKRCENWTCLSNEAATEVFAKWKRDVWHMKQRSHSSTRNISGALTSTTSITQENTRSSTLLQKSDGQLSCKPVRPQASHASFIIYFKLLKSQQSWLSRISTRSSKMHTWRPKTKDLHIAESQWGKLLVVWGQKKDWS